MEWEGARERERERKGRSQPGDVNIIVVEEQV